MVSQMLYKHLFLKLSIITFILIHAISLCKSTYMCVLEFDLYSSSPPPPPLVSNVPVPLFGNSRRHQGRKRHNWLKKGKNVIAVHMFNCFIVQKLVCLCVCVHACICSYVCTYSMWHGVLCMYMHGTCMYTYMRIPMYVCLCASMCHTVLRLLLL